MPTRTIRESSEPRTDVSGARRGFTLIEVIAVIGILSILLSIVVFSSRAIMASRSRSLAQQQLALIAAGIEQYASFWSRPEIGGVLIADRAWPDPFPIRVFNTANYQVVAPFNNHFEYRIENNGSGLIEDLVNFREKDRVVSNDGVAGDVLAANVCLTYALLSHTGKGPYLEETDAKAVVRRLYEVDAATFMPTLPAPIAGNANSSAETLVDPWGLPYRYFWVYRDSNAYRGYLPVSTADTSDANFRKAVGYVVESAGPDGKFGNVWQLTTTTNVDDVNQAADNLALTAP